jgi:release factor glutamine methyltransferase
MKYFYKDITLDVPESVYYPREDAEMLAKCLEDMDLRHKNCLEVGCGSGLLSIIMAKNGAFVIATDINPEAVYATQKNADNNKVRLIAFVSDLFEKVNGTYDLVVFNPPYLPVDEWETDAVYAGGKTGRDIIERFVKDVKKYLNPGGSVLMLISSLTGEKEVIDLFKKHGLKTKIIAREKIPWEELIVIEAK